MQPAPRVGRSPTAKYYGLSGKDEAAAYSGHTMLGPRLRSCCKAILSHFERGVSAEAILGPVDALKLRSSMEIFHEAAPDDPLFKRLLEASN